MTEIKLDKAETKPLGNALLLERGTAYLWQKNTKIESSNNIKTIAIMGEMLKITAFAKTLGTLTKRYKRVQRITCRIFGSYNPRKLLVVFSSKVINSWCCKNMKEADVMLKVNSDIAIEKSWFV